ncbi:MAG TPA: hypothetical protein DCE42_17755 [Myxococcales bacterium]|nr:hypothetical protein [Deltaproteobacteria bacterium]MBU54205.1 hypothetical protein [Deltaproteobacteria bacterium]HAA56614.1 hypothetical protein [Myxococcales bacterium]|tara:strand:+ start:4181 stop:5101 length:921 start_codon:yes stop_codon:yes gene_type:complete
MRIALTTTVVITTMFFLSSSSFAKEDKKVSSTTIAKKKQTKKKDTSKKQTSKKQTKKKPKPKKRKVKLFIHKKTRHLKVKTRPKFFLGANASQKRSAAMTLNVAGFQQFRLKQYAKAAALFRKALKQDDTYAMAHWNLVRSLSILRAKRLICPNKAYLKTILTHLQKAFTLSPNFKRSMTYGTELSPVRATLRYQSWLGHTPTKTTSLPLLLQKINWYSPSVGAFGPTEKLNFKSKGEVELMTLDRGKLKWKTITGTYTLKGRSITLKLSSAFKDKKVFVGTFDKKGTLHLKGLANFSDDPSDCSA